jgi:hypothetical protein
MTIDDLQKMSVLVAVNFMQDMEWSHVWPNVDGPDGEATNAYPQTDRVLSDAEKLHYIRNATVMAAAMASLFFRSINEVKFLTKE